MRYLKMLTMAGLAALALMAVVGAGTASASQPKAEPEGELFPVTFTGSGEAGKLETVPVEGKVRTVTCKKNTSEGEVNTATTAKNVKVKFKECSTEVFGLTATCTGGGGASGEIWTKVLKGEFVYVKSGSNEIGVDLKPESGTLFAEFNCGGVFGENLSVGGTVVGILTPPNTLTKAYTLTFTQTAGKQSPEGFLAPTGCAFTKDVLTTTGTGVDPFTNLQSGVEGKETLSLNRNTKVASTSCS